MTFAAVLSLTLSTSGAMAQPLSTWLPQHGFKDRVTTGTAAVATLGNNLCMAWHGADQTDIYVSVSPDNGKTWSAPKELKGRASKNGPALCAVNDHYVMAWRGLDSNIWVSVSKDGLNWSPRKEIKGYLTSDSPALAGISQGNNSLILMSWKSHLGTNIWTSTSADGLTWTPQRELKFASKSAPSVTGTVTKNAHFLMAWRGINQDKICISKSTDGVNWTPEKELTALSTFTTPAVTHSDQLGVYYMAWKGPGKGENIWVSHSQDGANWSPQVELRWSTHSSPALTPAGNSLFMVWRGHNENYLWGSTLKR
jgi:predicted GH43/DUF377 family glycosyl hydrolase